MTDNKEHVTTKCGMHDSMRQAGVEFCKRQLVLIPGTPEECAKVKS